MNPSDDTQNYWQDQPQQAAQPAETNHQQSQAEPQTSSDYPTETYQPGQPESTTPIEQPGKDTHDTPKPKVDEPPVTWSAKEYVDLEKGFGWYVIAVVVLLALIAADIFFLKSYTFSVLVVVMSVALVIYIRRPARTIQYTLSGRQGLYIGEQLHHLSDFRAFGLIEDGDHHSIMLIPVKRFSPGVSVYFPEEAGEQIVDILGQRLPMETLKLDLIDLLVRKLRL